MIKVMTVIGTRPEAIKMAPVIATSKGAEGLDVTHGQDILIADEPEAFADAVLRLFDDGALRANLAANGRRLVEERYSWETCVQELKRLLRQVVEQDIK